MRVRPTRRGGAAGGGFGARGAGYDMSTVVTIGGSVVAIPRTVVAARLVPYVKGGVGSFAFSVRGAKLGTLPDPYLGKDVTVSINGTLRFRGEVASRNPAYSGGAGWVFNYQCVDLRHIGNWVPHTDSNNGLDQSTYNAPRDNNGAGWIAARAGRSVGQILNDILTMPVNAQGLSAHGIGNYTGLPAAPVLPAATAADLAALTFIPPGPVSFGGEKLLGGVESLLAQWAPWVVLRVRPDGTLRFLDLRSFSGRTLTMGVDPIQPTPLSRETTESASRVLVRGTLVAEMFNFSLSNGGLSEAPFAHDGLTVEQAKAAWTPADYRSPGLHPGAPGDDNGTCTCTSTTTVVVSSANPAMGWPANYFDQTGTGHQGTVFLSYSLGTTITTYAMRSIVANTALAAGGTSTLTLDRGLPHLNYDHYVITALTGGASAVWCVYQLPAWAAAKVAAQSTYPFAYRLASGAAASLTSTAVGTVLWSSDGNPPYSSVATNVQVDPVTGYVHFNYPTFLLAGGKPADDVRALVPIYVTENLVASPPDVAGAPAYAGQLATVEGVERTLTATVPAWRDPANTAAMQAWADNLLDSVKDPVEEGTVVYEGLYEDALEMGIALSIAGNGYATGWEASAIPVIECQLEWNTGPGSVTSHTTTMRLSSRKAHFSAEAFLKPDRTGVTFEWEHELDLTPLSTPAGIAEAYSDTVGAFNKGVANTYKTANDFLDRLRNPARRPGDKDKKDSEKDTGGSKSDAAGQDDAGDAAADAGDVPDAGDAGNAD